MEGADQSTVLWNLRHPITFNLYYDKYFQKINILRVTVPNALR